MDVAPAAFVVVEDGAELGSCLHFFFSQSRPAAQLVMEKGETVGERGGLLLWCALTCCTGAHSGRRQTDSRLGAALFALGVALVTQLGQGLALALAVAEFAAAALAVLVALGRRLALFLDALEACAAARGAQRGVGWG